jgi:hypothetical protein
VVTVRAHRTITVHVKLSRHGASLARAHRSTARVALLALLRGAYRPVASRRLG